jgi:cytochrome c oxidase subunit 2
MRSELRSALISPRTRVAALLALALAGCSGPQSALDVAGVQAGRVASLWWLTLAICATVYLIVMALLVATIARRRHGTIGDAPVVAWEPSSERRTRRIVAVGVALTVAILLLFLVADFITGRELGDLDGRNALVIEVIGHQWWWEVHYADSIPANRIVTANEIHIPVGRSVMFKLSSADVIHSFWIPRLHGKKDMIPGYANTMWVRADSAGVFRGQCAEFCGYEHAKMALTVVAEPAASFARWAAAQRGPAASPTDTLARRGREVFLAGQCIMCHTIAGTPAGGKVAPDLTHFASRSTIAAGTLPNTTGHLAGWILDPQSIKPGCNMPSNALVPDDLQALLAYLGSLQ